MNRSEIEQKVKEVIANSHIDSFPIDVIKIAKDYDIRVYGQYLPKNISGMIMVDEDKPIKEFGHHKVIVVNKYENSLSKRFTIAHELAHFFLNKSQSDKLFAHRDEDNESSLLEIDANYFASNLLMPENMVRRAVSDAKVFGDISDSFLVEAVSNVFQVTLPAASARLQQLNLIK